MLLNAAKKLVGLQFVFAGTRTPQQAHVQHNNVAPSRFQAVQHISQVIQIEVIAAEADLVLWGGRCRGGRAGTVAGGPGGTSPETWVVFNKCDIAQHDCGKVAGYGGHKWLELSARTGENFDKLLEMLEKYLAATFAPDNSVLITRARHRHLLESCRQSLGRALAEPEGREDIIAEELRLAARDLGRLTGRVDVEDVFDVIFRDFCIGK